VDDSSPGLAEECVTGRSGSASDIIKGIWLWRGVKEAGN